VIGFQGVFLGGWGITRTLEEVPMVPGLLQSQRVLWEILGVFEMSV